MQIGRMKLLAFFTALVALAIGGQYAWQKRYSPEARLIAVVSSQLNDPYSAKFSSVHFNKGTGYGCGNVNAKNAFGAYVGHRSFVVTPAGDVTFAPGGSAETSDPAENVRVGQLFLDFVKLQDNCFLP